MLSRDERRDIASKVYKAAREIDTALIYQKAIETQIQGIMPNIMLDLFIFTGENPALTDLTHRIKGNLAMRVRTLRDLGEFISSPATLKHSLDTLEKYKNEIPFAQEILDKYNVSLSER